MVGAKLLADLQRFFSQRAASLHKQNMYLDDQVVDFLLLLSKDPEHLVRQGHRTYLFLRFLEVVICDDEVALVIVADAEFADQRRVLATLLEAYAHDWVRRVTWSFLAWLGGHLK